MATVHRTYIGGWRNGELELRSGTSREDAFSGSAACGPEPVDAPPIYQGIKVIPAYYLNVDPATVGTARVVIQVTIDPGSAPSGRDLTFTFHFL